MILWKLQLKPSYEAHWQLKIVEIYNHCHPALLYNTAPNFKKIQKFRFNVKICLLGRQTWSEGKKEPKILSRLCALVRPTAPLCCGAVVMFLATTVLHCSRKVIVYKSCGEQFLLLQYVHSMIIELTSQKCKVYKTKFCISFLPHQSKLNATHNNSNKKFQSSAKKSHNRPKQLKSRNLQSLPDFAKRTLSTTVSSVHIMSYWLKFCFRIFGMMTRHNYKTTRETTSRRQLMTQFVIRPSSASFFTMGSN